MILVSRATAPSVLRTEAALSGLSVNGAVPSGSAGTFALITAQLPGAINANRSFLTSPVLRLPYSAYSATPLPPPPVMLRLAARTVKTPELLASSAIAPTYSRTETTLATLGVNGVLGSGSPGTYLLTRAILLQPPPIPPPPPLSLRVLNFSDTTPAAPPGNLNMRWQADAGLDPRNVSAYVPLMVGDAGSGGNVGLVPAPLAGSAAASMFLRADGHWAIPPTPQGSFAVEINGVQIASTANAGAAFAVEVDGQVIATYSS